MLTHEYKVGDEGAEVSADLLVQLLDSTCKLFEQLTNLCDNIAEAVLREYNFLSILSSLIERYFLSSDSPLQIYDLVDRGDLEGLKPKLDLMFSFMHMTNNLIEHDKEARENVKFQGHQARYHWRTQVQEIDLAISGGLDITYMRLVQVYEEFDQRIRS